MGCVYLEFIRKQLKQVGKSQKNLRKSIESSKVQTENFNVEEIDISGTVYIQRKNNCNKVIEESEIYRKSSSS